MVCHPNSRYFSYFYSTFSIAWQKLNTPSAMPTELHFCYMGKCSGQQISILAYCISISIGFRLGEGLFGSKISSYVMVKFFIILQLFNLLIISNIRFNQRKFYLLSLCNFLSVFINVYNKMPKLRKHSNLNKSNSQQEQNAGSNSFYLSNKVQQSNSLLDKAPLVGRKIKYSQRTQFLKEFDTRVKDKSAQQTALNNSLILPSQCGQKVEMQKYFDKFTDDDREYSKESLVNVTKSKAKKGIRVSNKFFSNYEFQQGEIDEKQFENQELLVQKRQVKNADYLLNKVQKKAQRFKNRLDFKNCEQDLKFKESMKDKLKSLQGCEQVDLLIEVPQVISGRGHVDAALFLKNVKPTNEGTLTNDFSQELQQQVPKDRKSFYQGLVKKMKLKKAESMTESILKQNFKKSKLDQNDFIFDLHDKENSIAIKDRLSDKNIHKRKLNQPQQLRQSEQIKQNLKSNEQIIVKKQVSQEQSNNSLPSNQISKQQKIIDSKQEKIQIAQPKLKKPRKKRKGQKICIKDLIEEQAEDSDDCSHIKKEDNQSSQSQDGDLSSLIDDSITLCQEDEQHAHRKFVKDMIEQEERKFEILQKKMHQQRMLQDQHLRKRMEAASKRNNQKEQTQSKFSVQEQAKLSQASEQSISNAKNLQKLKQLQIDLGLKKPISSQSNPLSQKQTINKSIINIQKLMALQMVDIRKPVRNGLKNVERIKAKQMKKGGK